VSIFPFLRLIFLESLDLPLDIPLRLFEILDHVALFARSPYVFDRIPAAEIKVLRDLDTLDAARMGGVMAGVIDGVVAHGW
jgi:hypothetical protein